jgi:hypothetical protein
MDSKPRYRLISSRQTGGEPSREDQKYVHLAAGETFRLCQIQGRGRIVRFWLTLPVVGNAMILKQAVLRMYWDDEAAASVEAPVGDFFGAAFGKPVPLVSDRVLIAGGAYLSRFEMPFNEGAVIEISNESRRALRYLFFQIGYYEEPARAERQPTLHAQFRRENPTRAGEPFTVLRARGKGWLAGVKMDIENRSWWLRPPLRHIALPRGFGLGVLEGWESIVVDDERASAITGTGGEDYFSGGFYFKGAPFSTPTHGCTKRSFLLGRVSAYRFHVDDPIYFSESIEMTIDHGLKNSMEADCCSVAYWYQDEPHAPFPILPDGKARRVTLSWINAFQWALLSLLLAMISGAVVYGVFLLIRRAVP